MSEHEIYICSNNKWSFSTVITSEGGKQLIGYIMKQMEVALRRVTKYKAKLTANINTVTHEAVGKLIEAGLSLEAIINNAVTEFYREVTKTVVVVDHAALSRIRQEALVIQEKLIVPEQENPFFSDIPPQEKQSQLLPDIPVQEPLNLSPAVMVDKPSMAQSEDFPSPISGPWENLKNELTEIEIKALSVVLHGEMDLKKYADECGVMLEVLVEGINEKAMDFIGDSLLDDEFVIYDDYKEQVKDLIR